MIEETLQELRDSIGRAHESLRRELSRLRTGRASADLLDSIRVDYYGTPTPVAQMASVTIPEPRLLVIKPWEKGQIKAIESAIQQSSLGLTPQNDGTVIRLPMPPLTEQRRKDLALLAHLPQARPQCSACTPAADGLGSAPRQTHHLPFGGAGGVI